MQENANNSSFRLFYLKIKSKTLNNKIQLLRKIRTL